jgi:hypothetical protein
MIYKLSVNKYNIKAVIIYKLSVNKYNIKAVIIYKLSGVIVKIPKL